jgi:Pectate lyase superfamily protein
MKPELRAESASWRLSKLAPCLLLSALTALVHCADKNDEPGDAHQVQPLGGSFAGGTYTISDSASFAIDGGFYHFSALASEELYSLSVKNPYQQWQFRPSGSGFTICSVGNGTSICLSDGGADLTIGLGSDVWDVAVSGSGYTLRSDRTGHYIADPSAPTDEATVPMSAAPSVWNLASVDDAGDGGVVSEGGDAATDAASDGTGSDGAASDGSSDAPPDGSINVVTTYGIKNDGSGDQTAAIQSAVDSAPSGSTLYFPEGTYHMDSYVVLPGNLTLVGQNDMAEFGPGSQAIFDSQNGISNLTLRGLILNGGGIYLGDPTTNVVIDHCTVENFTNQSWNAIYSDHSTNLQITNSLFQNLQTPATSDDPDDYAALTALAINDSQQLTIKSNTWSHFGEGAHLLWYDNDVTRTGPYIGYNTATGQERMWVEIQTFGTNEVVENTLIEHNTVSHPDVAYWGSFGISAAIGGSTGTTVQYNTLYADDSTVVGFYGYGIEMIGTEMSVLNNTLKGPWGGGTTSIVVAYWSGYTTASVNNNDICGAGSTPIGNEGAGGPFPSPGETESGNTVASTCSGSF